VRGRGFWEEIGKGAKGASRSKKGILGEGEALGGRMVREPSSYFCQKGEGGSFRKRGLLQQHPFNKREKEKSG